MEVRSNNKKSMFVPFGLLIVFLIGLVSSYMMTFTKEKHDEEYLKKVVELKILSQDLTKSSEMVSSGNSKVFSNFKKVQGRFVDKISQLSSVDPDTGDTSLTEESIVSYNKLVAIWKKYNNSVNVLLQNQENISVMSKDIRAIKTQIPDILNATNEVARNLVETESPTQQIYLATQQLMFVERINSNISLMTLDSENITKNAQEFALDTKTFKTSLEALIDGSEAMEVEAVEDEDTVELLEEIVALYEDFLPNVNRVIEMSETLFQISKSTRSIKALSVEMLLALEDLEKNYRDTIVGNNVLTTIGNVMGGLALLIFFYIGYITIRQEKVAAIEVAKRHLDVKEASDQNETAIMRLLDEMASFADGDLTTHATVSENITGAIADSVNFTIDALRSMVGKINDTTLQVSSAAHETQATAMHLSEASEQQAEQIEKSGKAINEMYASIGQVSENANTLSIEASKSVEIANKGSQVVQDSIHGMDTIREQIQETSKRIKRLGESSQEIGDIVEIINEISDQTNTLALNAAIQAAMAGDAGRGFAVVADEVQRLAERSGNATKQIESLVKTIQADTNEAIISMERSTTEVVNGAKLAQNAGGALEEIETVSGTLEELIQSISNTTKQQATASKGIIDSMNVVQDITTQTAAGTNETAASIGNLAELANDLRESVAGFTLPKA